MKARCALLTACCLSIASLSVSTGSAQTPPPAPQGSATDARALAETLFFTARGMMEAGRYAEACGKLTESYRLDPAAGTLLNLAVCNQKIGKIASAWGEFRDAQAEARRMNRPDREKLATDGIAAIEPELPFLAIDVPPLVRVIRGLEILRNGVPLQSAAWDTELPVDPGDVEVIERAPGYKPKTLSITMAYRQHATLSAEPLELAPVERAAIPFWTGRRTAGLLMMGAGVAAAVGGSLFGLQAIRQKNDSDASCPNYFGDLRCNQTGVSDMSNARTSAWVSDGAFGLAVLGLAGGAYFFFWGGGQERPAGWAWTVTGGSRSATGLVTHSF
jgi:tetratricopeptide (TPR) repeat protein